MNTHAFRLHPKQDLKLSLESYIKENQILSAVILTCVGSLTSATLRLAGETIKTFEGPFEIVSLVGTFSSDGCHLHISLSDKNGNTIGGHLKEGCLINTTAEIIIDELKNFIFTREFDNETGFKELVINSSDKK